MHNYFQLPGQMKPTRRVFISFHINDLHAKELLVQQAKSDRFELSFVNYAINEPFDFKWKTQCKDRINQTTGTICLIGSQTALREAVNWELDTSYALGKNVLGIQIYRDQNNLVPIPILNNRSPVVNWNIADIVAVLNRW